MSYLCDVAFAFKKADWESKILPTLSDAAIKEIEQAESYEEDKRIGFRLDNVWNWKEDDSALYVGIKPFVHGEDMDIPHDYCVSGENAIEYGIENHSDLGFINQYGTYFRFDNEVGMTDVDGIAVRLVALLLSKGVTPEEIKKAAIPNSTYAYIHSQVETYIAKATATKDAVT